MFLRSALHLGPYFGSSQRSSDLLTGLGCYFLVERGEKDKKREGRKEKKGSGKGGDRNLPQGWVSYNLPKRDSVSYIFAADSVCLSK